MTREQTIPQHKTIAGVLRRIVVNLGLIALSVVLCLVAVEVVLRLSTPKEIMRYFFVSPDSILHHKFQPGASGHYESTEFNTSYTISSLGFRDREFAIPKPPGVFRILMLGDSFTEGDGVELADTFSKQLERKLQSVYGAGRIEVVDAGVGSYSPLLEYLSLTHTGLKLQPDLVILNYDLSDAFDDITYTGLAKFDAQGTPVAVPAPGEDDDQGGPLVAFKDFLKDHTRIYNFIRLRIERYLEGIRHEGNFSGDLQYDKYAMVRPNYRPHDGDWKLSERYLLMIRDTLSRHNTDFWVNVYPYGMQVSAQEWAVGRPFWGFKTDTVYSVWPQAHIAGFCRSNGIRAIDMCQAFIDTARTVFPLYWPDNGHWKPRGQLVAAELFARELGPYLDARVHRLNPESAHAPH